MGLFEDSHQTVLRAAGWHSRGYLPHFDGIEVPQFITIHLADSIPKTVIKRWKQVLKSLRHEQERILLHRRGYSGVDPASILIDHPVAIKLRTQRRDGTFHHGNPLER